MAAPTPKFDFKMLVVPAILFFSKKLDMTDPNVLQIVRTVFVSGMNNHKFATLFMFVTLSYQFSTSSLL